MSGCGGRRHKEIETAARAGEKAFSPKGSYWPADLLPELGGPFYCEYTPVNCEARSQSMRLFGILAQSGAPGHWAIDLYESIATPVPTIAGRRHEHGEDKVRVKPSSACTVIPATLRPIQKSCRMILHRRARVLPTSMLPRVDDADRPLFH